MKNSEGYIYLDRVMFDSVLWTDKPFARGQAWIDMIRMASHNDRQFMLGAKLVSVKRGEFVTSEAKLASQWGWSRDKVRRFLTALADNESIEKKSTREHTTVTIVNYDVYQCKAPTNKTTKKPPTNHRQDTINKLNELNQLNNKKTYVHEIDFLWGLYPNKKGKAQAIKKLPSLIKKYGVEAIEKAIRCYSDEVDGQDLKYVKHGSTFFNSGIVDYIDKKKERGLGYFISVEDEETGLISRKWIEGA